MINKSKIVKDAQKFVAKGQLDKAIVEYCKITAATPNDTNTHNTIGDLYLKIGNKEKAILSFKSAADILNKDGFALKAIALYKKVLNINPDQVDVQMQMGKLNAERGMLANANENYMAAVSYFTKQGKRDKALDVYKILSNLNPKNMTLAQRLAEMYMSEGMAAEGVSKFLDLADIKIAEGDLNEAKQFLDRARNKGADRHDFKRVSAQINLLEGRIPEAIDSLERLRDQDPGDARILTLLSDAYIHAGRYEDAASTVEELLDAQPGNVDYRKKLIDINIKAGDFEAAWDNYRDLVDIHIDKKEYNKAQKLIQEYLEHNPESIEARQVLADMYTSIGREDKIAELHAEMAELYAKGGEREKALNIYSKLIEQNPGNEDYRSAMARIECAAPALHVTEPPAVPAEPEQPYGGLTAEPPQFDLGVDELTGGMEETYEPPAQEEDAGIDFLSRFTEEDAFELPSGEPDIEPGEGGPVYDLSDMPDALPPLDLEREAGEDSYSGEVAHPGIYDLSEEAAAGMGSMDVFEKSGLDKDETGAGIEEWDAPHTPTYDIPELDATAGTEPGSEYDVTAYREISSFEESITEADVYIKYGLYPKAVEVLSSLEFAHPSNPEILLRFMDICMAQNDMDCFVERSIQLAVVYKDRDMDDRSREVIDKALSLSPDNERLRLYLGEPVHHEELAAPDESSFAGLEDMSFSGLAEESPFEEAFERPSSTPVEEPVSSPDSIAMSEELAEADFYSKQGLYDEAKAIYRRLLAAYPQNDELWNKYNEIVAAERKPSAVPVKETTSVVLGEPETVQETARPEPGCMDFELDEAFSEMDAELSETVTALEAPAAAQYETSIETPAEEPPVVEDTDEGFFDLAAELREEMGADIISPVVSPGAFEDSNLDQVFQEFRKGVNEQLGSEDYETHYNLGIAYKEMGMIDEALSEFEEASKDPSRKLDCASMLGLCHLEKGEYNKAIEHFKQGLDVKGRDKEEYFGLKYDMATAYELSGDPASAFTAIADIYKVDQEFRDVRKRYLRLEKSASPAPADEAESAQPKDAKSRKSRVSYL